MIKRRKPKGILGNYVDELWLVDISSHDGSDIIMPTGHIHIVFNIGESYKLIIDEKEIIPPKYSLFGQFVKPIKVVYNGNIHQIGMAIKPTSILMFFGMSHSLHLNSIVDCKNLKDITLMKGLIKIIDENMSQEPSEIFDKIEDLLNCNINDDESIQKFNQIIKFIDDNDGNLIIADLAKNFGYSVITLQRQFKKNIGLTPKAYCNLIRFHHSVMSNNPMSFFYDQSHFINSCKKYTLKTPKELNEVSEITLKNMIKNFD
ncbi:helix-turn-helix domain-containing protein [Helicovermis profundi]|uniref:Helix-turn-helix domain-containing protein n=1 Tax=Helicovermis profundi TaxID=3065157 RepID=A0AAU9EKA6_9FIRM|nr:helix-turn-helix domain-containing protein [Clostridia bacterium S502]